MFKPSQSVKRPYRPKKAPSAQPDDGAQRFNCPVSSRCGGCQLSHLTYEEQLQWKQRKIEGLLGELCPVKPIIGMENPYHYRCKVHAVLARDKRLGVISGVYAAGTHHVVPVRHCLIEDTQADRIIQTITRLAEDFRFNIYNENTHRGYLRHVLVRVGKFTHQVMVVLVATSLEMPRKKDFLAALLAAHPEITTVVLNLNDRRTSMVLGQRETVLYGDGTIEDTLCGRTFRLSAQSFYQVNPVQTEVLYKTAIDLAVLTGGETLLDAYCGIGTIGLCAAEGCGRIIGVELNPQAVKDAKQNARRNHVTNVFYYNQDAGRFMTRMAANGEHPDVVVMDPPRAGSDAAFLTALLTAAPHRIVYVSCNPETLARDVRALCQGGYRAEVAVPVDMFPGTEHVETVCLLSKLRCQQHIEVDLDMDEMDLTAAEKKATYEEIKEYVLERTGLKVSNLYIAQVKQKCGIIERENYNKAKSDTARQPKCSAEKEKAIREALVYFGMIEK